MSYRKTEKPETLVAKRWFRNLFTLSTLFTVMMGACLASHAQTAPPDNWYLHSHYGLFSHYTWGSPTYTQTVYPDGTVPANVTTLCTSFDAQQYATDVAGYGVDYIMFTAWHYDMNLLYPSAAMDSWIPGHTSSYDCLQDVINAVHAKGIKVMFYIHVVDGYNFTTAEKTATGWNDSTNNYATWNNFVNDVVTELGNRYGTGIDGYYIDEVHQTQWATMIDKPRMATSLLAGNQNRVVVGNGTVDQGGGAIGYGSVEHLQGGSSSSTWISQSNQNAVPISANWWATKATGTGSTLLYTPEDMFRFTVLQAGVNAGGGGMAWDAGPYASLPSYTALWEDGIKVGLTTLGGYLAALGPAVRGTYPSLSFPTYPGTMLGNVPNGVVGTQSVDDTAQYLHVLTPPTGNTLTLPNAADLKLFGGAALVSNGHNVTLTQNSTNLTLTLGGSDTWSSLDTAIKLYVSGYSGTVTRVNDSDPSIVYTGTWRHSASRNAGDYQDDLHVSSNVGDYFQYTFSGTGIDYAAPLGVGYGNMSVYLDGVLDQTVNASNSTYVPQYILYSKRNLTAGSHTLKVVYISGSYGQLDFLNVITSQTPPDLALHAVVTASSSLEQGGWGAAKATDGITTTTASSEGWSSNSSLTANHTEYIQVDLGSVQTVKQVDLWPRDDGGNTGYGFPIDFMVQTSPDNQSWTTAVSLTGYAKPPAGERQLTFPAQSARYVRITGTNLRQNPNDSNYYRMQFAEVGVTTW